MTAPLTLDLAELVMPGSAAADGVAVGEAFRTELDRLWRHDQASGTSWRENLDSIALELDAQMPSDRLGRKLAGAVRNAAVQRTEEL